MVEIIISTADESGAREARTTGGKLVGGMVGRFNWKGADHQHAVAGLGEHEKDLGKVATKKHAQTVIEDYFELQKKNLVDIEARIAKVNEAIELLDGATVATNILEVALGDLLEERKKYQYYVELVEDGTEGE